MTRGPVFPRIGLRGWTAVACAVVVGSWLAVGRYGPAAVERQRQAECIDQAARIATILGGQRQGAGRPALEAMVPQAASSTGPLVLRTRAEVGQAAGFVVHQIVGLDCRAGEIATGVAFADVIDGPRGRPDEMDELRRTKFAAIARGGSDGRSELVRALRAESENRKDGERQP